MVLLAIFNEQFIALLANVCIPLVIGLITFKIAKLNIVSSSVTQFRQKWIDDLRNSISTFISKAEMLSMIDLEDDEIYDEHFKEFTLTQHKIELMLNPQEDDNKRLITILADIRDLVHEREVDEDTLDSKIDELLLVSKAILKREWNVVKKGK